MKYFSLLFFITFAISCSNDASKQDEESLKEKLSPSLVENPRSLNTDTTLLLEMGNLVFKDTIHNFGKMQEGEVVTYEFEFENKGKKDIIINEAKASCGCTVADYSTKPYKHGEKGTIKVSFDSEGKAGMNERSVIIKTNGNPSIYNVIIQAEVNPSH